MNLSQVQLETIEEKDNTGSLLQAEEARLLRIIEAIQGINQSKEWSSLKTEVFDNLVNVLEKDLKTEAEKPDCSPSKLNRITGKLEWARKYADLTRLENEYRVQLTNTRLKLHGKQTD